MEMIENQEKRDNETEVKICDTKGQEGEMQKEELNNGTIWGRKTLKTEKGEQRRIKRVPDAKEALEEAALLRIFLIPIFFILIFHEPLKSL